MQDSTSPKTKQEKLARAIINRLVTMKQNSIAPAGHRQPIGIARHLDVDTLHSYIMAAEARNVTGLFTIMRDMIAGGGHVTAVYSQRKLAVLANGWKIEPYDRKDEKAVWIAEQIEKDLKSKGAMFNTALLHLLGGAVWPAAVVEKVYKRSFKPGWNFEIDKFNVIQPVAFDYITSPAGHLRIYKAADDGTILYGDSVEPIDSQFIVHKSTVLTEVPEYFGGLMRAVLFWYLFATFGRDWWARFLDRFGAPFIKGTYDPNNPDSQFELENALSAAQALFGLVIPDGTTAELMQAQTTQGGDAFQAFHSVANAEISKILLGQTLSSDAQNIGFGGGQATVQNEVRGEITAFDALMLSHTIQQNYFLQLCKLNDWPVDLCPSITFSAVSNDDIAALAELIGKLGAGGLQVTDDAIEDLSLKFGFGIERKPITEGMGGFGAFPFSADMGPQSGQTVAVISPPPGDGHAMSPQQPVAPPAPGTTRQLAADAQAANMQIVAESLKPMSAALGEQGDAILQLLKSSTSRADFLDKLAKMEIIINPEAVDLLASAMSAGAANGVLASQPKFLRKSP